MPQEPTIKRTGVRLPDYLSYTFVDIVARPVLGDEDLLTEGRRSIFLTWNRLRDPSGRVRRASIDPIDFRQSLGNVHLLDAVDGNADFRYRVYGTQIALMTRKDWHGRYVSEIPAPIGPVLLAHYRRLVTDRLPLIAQISIDGAVGVVSWTHLALPLYSDDDSAGVQAIVVLSEPLLVSE